MARQYSAQREAAGATAVQDLCEILAPATEGVKLLAIYVSQATATASEQLEIRIIRVSGSPTSGSGGAAVTPEPLSQGDPAFGGTVEMNNTTQITGGTTAILHHESFNVLNGFIWLPTPAMQISCQVSEHLVVQLHKAPGAAMDIQTTVYFQEGEG